MSHFYKNGIKYNDGDTVLCTIKSTFVFGTIAINQFGYYVCHDNEGFIGSTSNDLKGHKFSWKFSPDYTQSDVTILRHFDSTNRKAYTKIAGYLYDNIDKDLSMLLFDKDIFKEYDKLTFSPTSGFFRLTNESGRVLDIKIGRFLMKIIKEAIKSDKKIKNYTAKEIEILTNNLIALQENKNITIEYYSGHKLLDAYRTNNYAIGSSGSSIYSSCMNNKPESILQLYIDNPEVVSVLVVKDFDKIIGRSLVWCVPGHKKIVDKQYTLYGWINNVIDEEIAKNDYVRWDSTYVSQSNIRIPLKKKKYEKYPYLDTFKYFDLQDYVLSNKEQGLILNSTMGGYDVR